MLASMAFFSLADTLVKVATSFLSPAQVSFFLFGGGLIIFLFMALAQGDRLSDSRAFSPILLLRYLAEVVGMVGMVMALANVPISSVGAITQASPLLVAVGAVIFLKENVGWRRLMAILVGFVGVLLIVQPSATDFDFAVLWAILALIALSVRDLTTRLVPVDMKSNSLATFTMIAAFPFTVGWVLLTGESFFPPHINWFVVIPMMIIGAVGYMLLIVSIRMAEVSVVMPFRYSRIIYLLVLGVLVFGEKPDALMLIGASLIIVSGTYMMWREKLAKQSESIGSY